MREKVLGRNFGGGSSGEGIEKEGRCTVVGLVQMGCTRITCPYSKCFVRCGNAMQECCSVWMVVCVKRILCFLCLLLEPEGCCTWSMREKTLSFVDC